MPSTAARAERHNVVTRWIASSAISSSCSAGPGMAGAYSRTAMPCNFTAIRRVISSVW